MMKNHTKALINIDSFKKPLIVIAVALFIVLAAFLVLLPNTASAETTTTTTNIGPSTVIIPIAGYYYYIDSKGGYHPCDFTNCASYVPYSQSQSYTAPYGTGSNCQRCDSGITRLTYNPYSTDGSTQYPIPQYIPYTKTGSIYPSNNYAVSPQINYDNGFNSPTYPPAVYVPFEKVGNTIKTGQAKAIPYYSFNANGMLPSDTSGSASPYTLGTTNTSQPSNAYANNGNGNRGGFIMTSSSY